MVANGKDKNIYSKPLSLETIKTLPLVLLERGSGTLEVVEQGLKQHNVKLSQLRIEMYLGSTESIKSYLLHSPCMAFLSLHSIQKELSHGDLQIIPVKGLRLERTFYFIQHQGKVDALPEMFMRFAKHHHNLS